MEINKSSLKRMLEMDDSELWRSIRLIASASGIRLDEKQARAEDLAAVRKALSSVSQEDVTKALDILSEYKR